MKRLVFTFFILARSAPATAGHKALVRKDPLRPEAYLVYNQEGREAEAIRQETSSKDRLNILDSTGEQTSRIEKDDLRKDGYIFETVEDR